MNEDIKDTEMEFEKHIEDALAGKKGEIERNLAEIIEQEKEKARRKIVEMEHDFQKGKDALRRHKDMLDEVAGAASDAGEKIRKHVDQARHCRTMIQRMAGQIGEECRQAVGIKQDVFKLYAKADEETRRLQQDLENRYGASIPFPQALEAVDFTGGLDREIDELAEFAKSLGVRGEERADAPPEAPVEACSAEPAVEVEEKPAEQPAPAPEAGPAEGGESDEDKVTGALESWKKTESFPGGGELLFYQSNSTIVLDGESLLDQMIRYIEDAKTLHTHLEETKSAKEQFFIKRDILNLQEYLRKIIIRAIKLCEKDTCDLPLLTSDIVSMQTLRDVLERLSMGNWSDPYDMRTFGEEINKLRASLFARTSDRLPYRKSILEQLSQA